MHWWTQTACTPCKLIFSGALRRKGVSCEKDLGCFDGTAFLAQDIFGGEVLGILLTDGNRHCFNRVGNCMFDLTSEQFEEGELDYDVYDPQTREEHFAKEEKRLRYELLREKLRELCSRSGE